jgi:hypothetical protein
MWKIFDDLIAAVPESSVVSDCLAGLSWFLVRSAGVGVSMVPREGFPRLRGAGNFAGMKTRDLARWVKSWNFHEAALGLAAINSALNAPEVAERNCGGWLDRTANVDIFDYLLDELRGKRVAVVGHFFELERLAAVCDLTILERRPQPGDVPDPACEYLLADQDVVIITATTLINKTLPRLLQLSRRARVVIAGPSTPLTPVMFDHGIDMLGGLLVENEDRLWKVVQQGGMREIFEQGGRMVKVSRRSALFAAD